MQELVCVFPFTDHGHRLRIRFASRALCCRYVRRRFHHRNTYRRTVRDSNSDRSLRVRSNCLHAESVSKYSVVRGLIHARVRELETRCMNAKPISKIDEHPELIHGEPIVDTVRQPRRHVAGVVAKRFCCIARLPSSAFVLQRLWEIPVIKCRERPNTIRKQLIDESIVKVEALWIRRSSSRGEHTRPRDRESIAFDAERLH